MAAIGPPRVAWHRARDHGVLSACEKIGRVVRSSAVQKGRLTTGHRRLILNCTGRPSGLPGLIVGHLGKRGRRVGGGAGQSYLHRWESLRVVSCGRLWQASTLATSVCLAASLPCMKQTVRREVDCCLWGQRFKQRVAAALRGQHWISQEDNVHLPERASLQSWKEGGSATKTQLPNVRSCNGHLGSYHERRLAKFCSAELASNLMVIERRGSPNLALCVAYSVLVP